MAIEFVGSQIAQSAAAVTSYTISTSGLMGGIDTQVRAGDFVIIAHGYSAAAQAAPIIGNATGLTWEGETAVYADDTNDTNMVVRWAKASETPAATITVSKINTTANSAGTVMFVFRGVDTIDSTIQQATGINSNTPDPPASLSATDAACAAVVFGFGAYTNDLGYTITAGPATSTGLRALQEGGATTFDLCAAGAYKLNIGTGALNLGAFTVSGTAITSSWAAATVILRPTVLPITFVGSATSAVAGSTTNSTIALNSGLTGGVSASVAAGDLVIAAFATGSITDRTLGITDGTENYTLIDELYVLDTTGTNLRVAYKFMGSTPDASTTFSGTGGLLDAGTMAVSVYRGVSQITPLDVAAATVTAQNTALANPPSITPVTPGAVVVAIGAAGHTGGVDTFSSSDLSAFKSIGSDDTYDSTLGIGHIEWGGGTVDPAAFSFTEAPSIAFSYAAMTIALRPAYQSFVFNPFRHLLPHLVR